ALEPKLLASSAAPTGPASAAAQANLPGDFAAAVNAVEAGERGGVDQLRRAANLGYAPAQSYLAELYAAGGAGLKKDPVEARRWAERAAQAGERKAMHNLALYLFEGAGGPKDAALAAQWFRRAAELGLVDSQFNLAQLYEHGSGVGLNGAEAYKWYLIAGRSGDAEARASALRLRERISPEARAVAERAAAAFRSTGGSTSGALAQS